MQNQVIEFLSNRFNLDTGVILMMRFTLAVLLFFTALFLFTKKFCPLKKNDEILLRIFSWWVIFFLYIVFFCSAPWVAALGLFILSSLGMREFYKILGDSHIPPLTKAISYIFNFLQFSLGLFYNNIHLVLSAFIVIVIVQVLLFERERSMEEVLPKVILTYLLCCFGLQHLGLVNQHSGSYSSSLVLYFIFLVQFNDVLQFLWGTVFGNKVFVGKKFAPALSPNKTWEGFIGGLISTAAISVYWGALTSFTLNQTILIGISFSLLGVLGDLTISAFKRNHNLKETGHVIPGHGGILDRIDSLLLNSLFFYYVIFSLR